ncbi:HesA/MoeB/ThiF family protein [Lactobacillus taiwanensis]|uniref:HesA/MoeB/ThiF family protein n=1 Tax=Lactobacillus taiwanensis TaxID=508451 RepID=UPI0025B014AC|nr:ThiF family adenylyltransferase [Lactobacillus taiwanensis]MDU6570577.1 ThiF family adenylyltransferase [Lactobacillus johnsonii]
MEYMFKYDVYGKINKNTIEILELVPKKRKYKIKLDAKDVSSAKTFISLLNQGTTSYNLKSILGKNSTINNIFKFLQEKNLLAKYFGDDHPNDPFARQIEMLDSFNRSSIPTLKLQKILNKKRILIIGAGGVGTALSNTLNACGIGHIFIIDADTIEHTNLSRQFLYNRDDIGKSKIKILSQKLNQRGLGKVTGINSMMKLSNYQSILKEIGKIDLITGMPFPFSNSLYNLYKGILSLGYPIYAIGEHDAGPIFHKIVELDKMTKSIISSYPVTDLLNQRRDEPSLHDRHPSFLPEIQISASLASAEIIKYFTQVSSMTTQNAMYSLHSDNYTVSLVKL